MKKLLMMACAAAALMSCSDDDNENTAVGLSGTWKLTTFTTGFPVDYNNDGSATTNFKNETGCYNNTTLVFGTNNTAIATIEEPEIDYELVAGTEDTYEFTVDCGTTTPQTGTYAESGNNVVITIAGDPATFVKSGNTLTLTETDPEEGTSTLVFTKQ
jgi:hypothetical protein